MRINYNYNYYATTVVDDATTLSCLRATRTLPAGDDATVVWCQSATRIIHDAISVSPQPHTTVECVQHQSRLCATAALMHITGESPHGATELWRLDSTLI